MRVTALVASLVVFAACSPSPSTAPTPAPAPAPASAGQPEAGGSERPGLTASGCEAQGGQVVGDIGDGAIHRPEYRCPQSGEAPIGSIVADPGGPIGVEGAVCCKSR